LITRFTLPVSHPLSPAATLASRRSDTPNKGLTYQQPSAPRDIPAVKVTSFAISMALAVTAEKTLSMTNSQLGFV